MTEEEINKAIARIILSTKRKNRQYSLFEIALDIQALKKEKGGMSEVSKVIGISDGMLNQFLSVFKLPQPIIELIKKRKIESVSIVHYLSKFNESDALKLSDLVVSNQLSSQDLRVLIPYRKQHLKEPILDLVDKLLTSKNIKASVIRIENGDTSKSLKELDSLFTNKIGKENIISIGVNKNFIDIKLSKDGEKILRENARVNNKTFQELITTIIN